MDCNSANNEIFSQCSFDISVDNNKSLNINNYKELNELKIKDVVLTKDIKSSLYSRNNSSNSNNSNNFNVLKNTENDNLIQEKLLHNINNNYFPGKITILVQDLFNSQKKVNINDNETFWETYTNKYFSKNCVYSILYSRNNKEWKFSKNIIY